MSTRSPRERIERFPSKCVCVVIRDHDDLKGAFAGPRLFICAAELANHLLNARKDRSTFARTDHGIGLCSITACCTEVRPEPIEIAEDAIIARLEPAPDHTCGP